MEKQDRDWYIVGRWQEFGGEGRANLLRIMGIGAFYTIHLMSYRGVNWGLLQVPKSLEGMAPEAAQRFHWSITALTVAWLMSAMVVMLCLRRHIFPAGLKFASTGLDVVLLTCTLLVADGPRSPIVVGYFLIIALSGLRFSLRLVWCATLGSMAGYLVVLGYARWYRPELQTPRYGQLMFVVALGLTGIILGQMIRRVRLMAQEYAQRQTISETRSA